MSRATKRLMLQGKLEALLGSENVYFQPPASISLRYPCIIYSYEKHRKRHANNQQYFEYDEYSVILITKDPLPDGLLAALDELPYTSFEREYTADNLHHFAYNVRLVERT